MVRLNVAKDEKLNHGKFSKWENYCEKQSIYKSTIQLNHTSEKMRKINFFNGIFEFW